MKFSISNIAWAAEFDEEMYGFLKTHSFDGLEIAPTRIFPETPYDNVDLVKGFASELRENYGLAISSMQSIWYGLSESIFGTDEERQKLIDYTFKAIDFANAAGCRNLVFGCPKNRVVPPNIEQEAAVGLACEFFIKIGDYAASNGTVIAIEPNPPIYNTNFINTTMEAFDICCRINNSGVKVNLDLGTIIYNEESLNILRGNIHLVNHIHISEPNLKPIENRGLHGELFSIMREMKYDKFVSIEMGNPGDIDVVKRAILYVEEAAS